MRARYKSWWKIGTHRASFDLEGRLSARAARESGLAIASALITRSLKCPLSFGFNDGEVNVDKVHAMAFRVLTHCTLVGSVIAIDYGPTFRQRTVR